jgi:CO/xanthine dehydrogenase FAD-binding subunit
VRARSVEQALAGGASTQDAAEKVLDDVELRDDALASAWYRRRTLPVLVRRALDNLEGGE